MATPFDQLVRVRAGDRCEYCRMPQAAIDLPFPADHIIARQHGGATTPENLALACTRCNLSKGPNIAGIDPDERMLTRLFNPRTDSWDDNFSWQGAVIVGRTPIARATVRVLAMNDPSRVALREAMIDAGRF